MPKFSLSLPISLLLLLSTISLPAQSITQFVLIDAASDTDWGVLTNGQTLDPATIPASINIRADVSGSPGSVVFSLSGPTNHSQTENAAPFALFGDSNGDYNGVAFTSGNYTLTATPYSASGGTGTAGTALTISFSLSSGPPPPPAPGCGDPGANTVQVTGELRKWHKITLVYDGPGSSESCVPNPFLDYRLQVTFTHPGSGTSYTVPGYFAADGDAAETSATGGHIWHCHFSPDHTGQWNYTTSFRTGSGVAIDLSPTAGTPGTLDGLSGSFNIQPTNKTGRDLRGKGRLQYIGERYLRFAETNEFFLKGGADAPENIFAYDDFDNTPDNGGRRKSWSAHLGDWNPGDPDWQNGKGRELIGALNYLSGKGMNVFSFLTLNTNGDDKNVFPFIANNGQSGFQEDRLRYDVSKLAQWEIVMEHADKVGLYLHFKTQETENDQLLDGGQLGTQRKLYYRELIARFGHHLALNWNLGEENDIWNELSDPQNSLVRAYAQYVRTLDPYEHLVVIHTYPGDHDEVYGPMVGDTDALTGASIQTGWNNVHNATKKWIDESRNSGHNWVVANDEQGPANTAVPPDEGYNGFTLTTGPSQDDIRRGTLWGNLMAGGAGVEYYFGYGHPQSDLTCQDWRSRDNMWNVTNYALEFFRNQLPFWEMHSSDGLVSNGYCFADTGQYYAVYLPSGGTNHTIDLAPGNYERYWYNPRTGGSLIQQSNLAAGQDVALGSPPSQTNQDWVVLLVESTNTGNTFPLELLDFRVAWSGEAVQLDWITMREENTSHFQVERSTNNQGFVPIGQVQAAGFSQETRQYQFLDQGVAPGRYFYRLKMVDLDGSSDYSKVVEVISGALTYRFLMGPNPANESTHLYLDGGLVFEKGWKVHLFDLAGRVVLAGPLQTGKSEVEIELKKLDPGIYFWTVQNGEQILGRGRILKP